MTGTAAIYPSNLAGAQDWQKTFLDLGIPNTMSRDNAKGSHIQGEEGMVGGLSGTPILWTVERKTH